MSLQTQAYTDALLSDRDYVCQRERAASSPDRQRLKSARPRWQIGIRWCTFAAFVVLLLNCLFLLVNEQKAGFPPLNDNQGRRVLYNGRCDTVRKLNTGIHLVINILGTVLLGASNYCMQCMGAPTRAEVDKTHKRFGYVDIGVSGIRNLFHVRKLRVLLWLSLALSSFPLHLVYVRDFYIFAPDDC